jgi:hypothetical protein
MVFSAAESRGVEPHPGFGTIDLSNHGASEALYSPFRRKNNYNIKKDKNKNTSFFNKEDVFIGHLSGEVS